MPRYVGPLTLVLLLAMVLVRLAMLCRKGVRAMQFGRADRSDFLILPFVLFYFYLVFAGGFGWPVPSRQQFFQGAVAWVGTVLCLAGLGLLLASLVSFGHSFRVGIDTERPDELVTTGVFAVSRNPIYVAFALVLLGQFLLFSNWIMLAYLLAAAALFHRQVRREEEYLTARYGRQYSDYCRRVRRYL